MQLSQHQANFLNAKTRGKIYLGSIGSGKTFVMCINSIHEALLSRYTMIVSFSYRNLKDVVFPLIKELCEKQGIPYIANISDMSIIINNVPILLRTAENPDRLRSFSLHSVFIEEAREVSREVFDILLGRLRRSEDSFWAIVSTTRGKNWFYDIIKKEGLLDIFNQEVRFLHNENLSVVRSTIYDSPFLPQSYIKDLENQYTTSFAKQELEAKIIDNSGGIINTDWFKISNITGIKGKSVRGWDFACSTKDNADYSVGVLMVKTDKYCINDVKQVKLQWPDLRKLIIETAKSDGKDTIIALEKVGTQLALIDDLTRSPELQGYIFKTVTPTKDLITRSLPWISQAEMGNIILNKSPWNREYLDECSNISYENFGTVHDDQISATTIAYDILNANTAVTLTNLNSLYGQQKRMW